MDLERASALQFGINVIKTGVGALATIFFVQELGAGVFGRYTLVAALISWIIIPTTAISSATSKRVSEGKDQNEFFSAGFGLEIGFLLVAVLGILVFRGPIAQYTGFNGVTLVAGLLVARVLFVHQLDVLRSEGQLFRASFLDGGRHVLQSVCQVLLVVVGAELVGLLGGEMVAYAISVGVAFVLTRLSFVLPTRETIRGLYEFGKFSWLAGFKGVSYGWLDTIVLGFFVLPRFIGVYEVAWRISAMFVILPQAIHSVTFPEISRQSSEGRSDEASATASRALTYCTGLAIPGIVGTALLGEPVMAIYGQSVTKVAVAPVLLLVLVTTRLLESYEIIITGTLGALDHPDRAFRVDLAFFLTNIVLNVSLVWTFGVVGAAVATLIAMGVGTTIAWYSVPDTISIGPDRTILGAQLGSAFAMGLVVLVLQHWNSAAGTLQTLVYVGIGGAFYVAGLITTVPEIRQFLKKNLRDWADT